MFSLLSENDPLIVSRGFHDFPTNMSLAKFAYDHATPQISQNPLQRHELFGALHSDNKDKITLSLDLASFIL